MGQSSSWYFERLFHRGTSPNTKLAFIEKFYCSSIPSLEFLVLSDGDPWNSNITRDSTLWWVVDFYIWQHGFLCSKQTPNLPNPKKGKIESAVWLGASWLENTQTLTGIVNVREILGDLADYLGEEAEYTAALTPVNKWNMVIGGSLAINKHYNIALEAGFIGRKKISLGILYRF